MDAGQESPAEEVLANQGKQGQRQAEQGDMSACVHRSFLFNFSAAKLSHLPPPVKKMSLLRLIRDEKTENVTKSWKICDEKYFVLFLSH